uniref:Uncharacterized protein n=1 Tax=Anguilla anguilla TaxID=7936 RepID=A0A0E9WN48_ANGAN
MLVIVERLLADCCLFAIFSVDFRGGNGLGLCSTQKSVVIHTPKYLPCPNCSI